jgi:hypothetical protein
MQIRRYTLGMILFVILVGWYTFVFITQESATIDLFFFEPTLPVAFWALVPVMIFYAASVLHMTYYSAKRFFKLRHYTKDFETMSEAIRDALIGKENRNYNYSTERYKLMGKIIDNVEMIPLETMPQTGDSKLDTTISNILKIENGEVADLKRLKDKQNVYVVMNQINQLDNGDLKPVTVFDHSDNYDETVAMHAFDVAIEAMPVYELEKYKRYMSKEALFDIMGRIGVDKNKSEVETESILALTAEHELDEREYLEVAKKLSSSVLPDQRLKIFESLYDNNDAATAAYLYVLFDLEMIDLADEVLSQSNDDEFLAFRAYRELKAMHKHYPIDIFIG